MDTTNIIPSDAPSIFAVLDGLSNLEKQAIVRPNNPPPGIGGFLFDIPGDDEVELETDITDHYLEDNTPVQDQASLKPEIVRVKGFVAEVVNLKQVDATVAPVANPLPDNPTFVPVLTPGAIQTQAESQALAAKQTAAVTSGQSFYGYFNQQAGKQPNETRQAKVFSYFYQLWKGRELFSVETPNGIWTNMMIASIKMTQTEETKEKSEVAIVFKKIRTVTQVTVNAGQLAGRAALEASPTANNGNIGTTPATPAESQSLLYRMTHPSP